MKIIEIVESWLSEVLFTCLLLSQIQKKMISPPQLFFKGGTRNSTLITVSVIWTLMEWGLTSGRWKIILRKLNKILYIGKKWTLRYGGRVSKGTIRQMITIFNNSPTFLGGETASDVLDEWYPNVKQIIWCIPRGQHFFRKRAKILPHRKPQALDKASSRAIKFIAPFVKSKPGMSY